MKNTSVRENPQSLLAKFRKRRLIRRKYSGTGWDCVSSVLPGGSGKERWGVNEKVSDVISSLEKKEEWRRGGGRHSLK